MSDLKKNRVLVGVLVVLMIFLARSVGAGEEHELRKPLPERLYGALEQQVRARTTYVASLSPAMVPGIFPLQARRHWREILTEITGCSRQAPDGSTGPEGAAPGEDDKNACLFEVHYDTVGAADFHRDLATRVARIYFAQADEMVKEGDLESARERLLQVLIRLPEKAVRRQAAERIFATFAAAPSGESPHAVFAARSWIRPNKDRISKELIDYYGAEYLYRRRHPEEAEKLIKEILPLHRGSAIAVDIVFLMALCHIKTDNYDAAEKELGHIIDTYPAFEKRTKARFLIGWMAMTEENYRKAREIFESIIKDFPKDTFADHAKDLLRRIPEPT